MTAPVALAALAGALIVPFTTSPAAAANANSAVPIDRAELNPAAADFEIPAWLRAQGKSLPDDGRLAFMLELDTATTGDTYVSTRAHHGEAQARSEAKDQLDVIESAQDSVVADLPDAAPDADVLYRTHAVVSGVTVQADVNDAKALSEIDGVKAVHPIAPKTVSNAGGVPLIGGDVAWQTFDERGDGVTVGILDTGIDFTHANFGGEGTVEAYEAADAVDTEPTDLIGPGMKVAGGTDLVGDDYDASTPGKDTPVPDPNPLDCQGHGSHVAGTVGGFGVNADGTTYTGPYDETTPFQDLRIGPGVAPEATLYAVRVFGCEGSTNVVGQAIDFSADPNGDGDTSDHLDVVNLSLGSDFSFPDDADGIAMNNAATLGIVPVVASGNAGDLFDAGGGPGNAPRAIGVAASDDGFAVVDGLQVDSPASIADTYASELSIAYDYASKPGITNAEVATKLSAANEDGCDPLSPADAAIVAGKVAFLEWTDNDSNRRCGSAQRSGNVRAAGAIGFIFADDENTFAAGITGDPEIPGLMVTKDAGDTIRPHLSEGVHVTITGALAATVKLLTPETADQVAGFSSRGMRGEGNVKPDVTAVGLQVFSTAVGTGNQGVTMSGTSMATPMTAGLTALVVGKHPEWNTEEVKADIMNTAGQDLFTGPNHTGEVYPPNRVGTGRVQAPEALSNQVLAYVADDPGVVSVGFGPLAVTGPTRITKDVRVVNKSDQPMTFDVDYDALSEIPGVRYDLSVPSISLNAHGQASFGVSLVIDDPSELTKTHDPTIQLTQGGNPRQFLADASGRIVLSPSGDAPSLRVPVYSAPRPASTMTQASVLRMPNSGVSDATINLTGTGINQGSGSEHIQSLVSGYELLGQSPPLPQCAGDQTDNCVMSPDDQASDIRFVGAASDGQNMGLGGGSVFFAVNAWHAARNPAGASDVEVVIDTNNDGAADAILFSTRLTDTDVFVSVLVDANDTSTVLAITPLNLFLGNIDTDVFDSDTVVLQAPLSALPGVRPGHTRISFGVATFNFLHNNAVDTVGVSSDEASFDNPMTIDVQRPGAQVGVDQQFSSPVSTDMPGTLFVQRDADAYAADHAMGLLLVHHHNVDGSRAQPVLILNGASSQGNAHASDNGNSHGKGHNGG